MLQVVLLILFLNREWDSFYWHNLSDQHRKVNDLQYELQKAQTAINLFNGSGLVFHWLV